MTLFLFALQFLTIIPVRTKRVPDTDNLSRATLFFPFIGLFLGLILVGLNICLSLLRLDAWLSSVILVSLLTILTGALHLDGLADTFDALGSRQSPEKMLAIMRDSHIGTMGMLSMLLVILLKVSLLSALPPVLKNQALLLMGMVSRTGLVLLMGLFPYARKEGKASPFMDGMRPLYSGLVVGLCIVLTGFLGGVSGLLVCLSSFVLLLIMGRWLSRKIGGITGDILGAGCELSEVLVLFGMVMIPHSFLVC